MKKSIVKGTILVEAAFSMLINMLFLFGGLEFGWYLYSRQALVGAAREGVRAENQNVSEQVVQSYLIGMDYPDDFIEAVTVNLSTSNPSGATIYQLSLSVPLEQVLLFGGVYSYLYSTSNDTHLTVTAYERENDFKKKGKS